MAGWLGGSSVGVEGSGDRVAFRCVDRLARSSGVTPALLPTSTQFPTQTHNPNPPPQVKYDELSYNGQDLSTFVPERTASYISQLDQHYGELTVRQTMEFSARVQGGRHGARCLPLVQGRQGWGGCREGSTARMPGRRHAARARCWCMDPYPPWASHTGLLGQPIAPPRPDAPLTTTTNHRRCRSISFTPADMLEGLEEQEKALGVQPDPDIQSYMAALNATGKGSFAVDIMLVRVLGSN